MYPRLVNILFNNSCAMIETLYITFIALDCSMCILFLFVFQVVFVGFLLGGLLAGFVTDAIGRKMVSVVFTCIIG